MTIKISQVYHSVGHGTFHTGTAWGRKHGMFRWAYDCGSKRKSHLTELIQKIAFWSQRWAEGSAVDLLVISHFDDDHVNGVELFLKTWKVKWLVLPYAHLSRKLENVSDHGGASCSPSTALFQLSPQQWLVSRGLENRVSNILEIRGGPIDEPEERSSSVIEPNRPNTPNQPSHSDEITSDREHKYGTWHADSELDILAQLGGATGTGSNEPSRFYSMNHHKAFRALNSNIEFMFYNSDEPAMCTRLDSGKLVANRSKTEMQEVSRQVLDVVRQYKIGYPDEQPKTNWRKKLRYVYDQHFGKSSKKRNSISLCLYVRPLCTSPYVYNACKNEFQDRYSSLSLGDFTITPYNLNSLETHFGKERWESLAMVQVPHHGSRHSWHSGAAAKFGKPYFVHCIPNSSAHHPHPEVEEDLEKHEKLIANYSSAASSFIEIEDKFSAAPGNMHLIVCKWYPWWL